MKSKNFQRVWLAALLLGPIVLFFLPADTFDDGITLCPSVIFFNYECWGCGITRAIMHLLHFDFDTALYFNKGVVVIFPILVYVWWLWVKDAAILGEVWPKKA